MSAYTLGDEHIAVLVHAGLSNPGRPLSWHVPTPTGQLPLDATTSNGITASWAPGGRARQLTTASADAVGQMLLDQNIASINEVYSDDDLAIYNHRRPRSIHRRPVEILKAIACYRYQAGDTRDWNDCEAFHFCAALEAATIYKLPGWDEAAWAIGRETPILSEHTADTSQS